MANEKRVIQLPMYDANGFMLREVLEVDVEFFLSSTQGLRSNQSRVVDLDAPDPTPEQEIEFIDRIIAGLPAEAIVRPHPSHEGIADILFPNGVKIYDVNSLYPTEFFSDWYPITNFDDYEVNSGGQVRNRHNKHILDYEPSSSGKYVKMRNDKGEQLIISVDDLLNQVFGI
ncbi:hypothetical protein GORDON_70 [Arthrobacter phage Gordon]|uniref:Uncharacterized protein n=1 Tax=Arthrobacter phage Gordon TaxID=1772298 RepID=A0A0U4JB29_9CAUD|nr:hypothetical protein FDH69_gp70 [Arthrobacter phage Gordon]ALY09045.1 hypothetical protein GORDON_70 [Arthrobacter phage Gordon]